MPRLVEEIPIRSIYQDSYRFIEEMKPGETALFTKGEDFNSETKIFNSSIRNYLRGSKIDATIVVRGDHLYVKRNS
jgi:hypothetical protein